MATRLIEDPEYIQRLRDRLLAGTAGAVEIMLWHYAYGKPPDRIESMAQPFAALSSTELKERLVAALRAVSASS